MENNSVTTCDWLLFLHSALYLIGLYQCIKFHLIPFHTLQRYTPDKLFIAKIKMGSNSVKTGDRVTVGAFCTFSDSPVSMY